MEFGEIQKKISDLYQDTRVSVAEYISLAHALGDGSAGNVPSYIRTLKAAFLGSFTIQGLPEVCKARGIFHNLRIEIYLAAYNQFTQEAINAESELARFNPDIVYAAVDAPEIMDRHHLEIVCRGLLEYTKAKIIFFNFASSPQISPERARELNRALVDLEKKEERIIVFNFAKFLQRIGKDGHWYTKYKQLGDMRLAPSGFAPLSEELIGYGVARAGNTKKCLVLDLDNTLWKGIIGEDGMRGIVPNRKFQRHILGLHEKGVILAINSKNNMRDAQEVFEHHPDMVLKENHIAAWRVNWQDKDRNMAEIAQDLDLGTDSFVFVDDSGFEQERVKTAFPEIAVLSPDALADFRGFFSFKVTKEDMRRGAMYVEERKRKELRTSLPSEDEFLSTLGLSLIIRHALESDVARVSQLTQKTNQFNLTTRRYTEDEIRSRIQDNAWNIRVAEAKDRFGDYGAIGIAIIEHGRDAWRIDNFLLSCRILGRKVEKVFLHALLDSACQQGIERVIGEFIPSAKNKLCESFLEDNKFVFESCEEKKFIYHWTSENKSYTYPHFIKLTLA